MTLKSAIRPFVPPALYEAASRFKRDATRPEAEEPPDSIQFFGDYATFQDALSAANDPGYNGVPAIDRYVRRYNETTADIPKTVLENSAALLPFMAAIGTAEPVNGIIEIFDLGGGYGSVYDLVRGLYPSKTIRWTVVELPALVARGHEMGQSDMKQFATTIPDRRYSLGIVSGVLQYLEDPATSFRDLIKIDVPLMMLNRFHIATFLNRDRLAVQRVPATLFPASFPCWFFSPQWNDILKEFGEIQMRWSSPGDNTSLDGRPIDGQAMLLRR